MDMKDEAFLKRLLATFKVEAAEHLVRMSSGLVDLENAAAPDSARATIEAIFREAHSLKGAAGSLNLVEIESICQAIESLFSAMKRQEMASSPSIFDLLHRATNLLGALSESPEAERKRDKRVLARQIIRELEESTVKKSPSGETRPEPGPVERPEAVENVAASRELQHGKDEKVQDPHPQVRVFPPTTDTVRIPAVRLESIMHQAEEMTFEKLNSMQRVSEIGELKLALSSWNKKRAATLPSARKLRVDLENHGHGRIPEDVRQDVRRLVELLEGADQLYSFLEQKVTALQRRKDADLRSFSSKLNGLVTDAKKALMLPLSSLVEVFPKLVRDLSHEQGKKAELTIKGADLELDRRILEEIKDALIHLARNCLDHGIEKPEERLRLNKPETGSISIEVRPKEGDKVEIVVADDGRGVDVDKLKAHAIKTNVISQAQAEGMSDADSIKLAFVSGVSTSPIITDISGRGLGLAIVSEKVETLGGRISVDSSAGLGTTFRLTLPVTLATFRGILVRAGERFYIIPSANTDRVLRLGADQVKTVENRETVRFDGRLLSLVALEDVLGLSRHRQKSNSNGKVHIVILNSGDTRIAFLVDEIIAEQEVLLKRLGKQLARVRCIAGATVTGAGRVVPVLSPGDLVKAALKVQTAPRAVAEETERAGSARKNLLVIEDSITARTLLKNILEGAGYDVKTAVDGVEAFALLRTEPFDLVVSDIDMPRMNGLELTARIRADKKLADLPVVLVTALNSPEDRERGIDAGANAYIVKSSFDQSNLLEVIKRLV